VIEPRALINTSESLPRVLGAAGSIVGITNSLPQQQTKT
jgi:hypothetical protein